MTPTQTLLAATALVTGFAVAPAASLGAGCLKLRAVGEQAVKRTARFTVEVGGEEAQSGTIEFEVRRTGARTERYVYVAD